MTRTLALLTLFAALPVWPQQQQQAPLMRPADAFQMFLRSVDLAEATAIAVPGLQHAANGILEDARLNLRSLERSSGQQHTGYMYALMVDLRAYLDLSDAVPKPLSLPETSRKQFEELRANVGRLEIHFRASLDARELQVRGPDRDNLARYANVDSQLSPPQPGKPRIVFLGDSITDGWRLNEYFPEKDYVNRGIGGQISGQMLGRMQADVVELKPAAVLILAGTNDLAWGISISTITSNYKMIADLADANRVKVIFASVLPVSDYGREKNPNWEQTTRRPPALIRSLNDWLVKFCKARNYTYLDYYTSVADGGGFLRADLADDGLHPNSTGYRIMAPLAQTAIEKAVRAPAPQAEAPTKRRFPF